MAENAGTINVTVRGIVGFFDAAIGQKSMGRLISFIMTVAGIAVALSATVIAAVLAFTGNEYGAWVGVILGGLTESGGAGAMKVWQKRVESRDKPVPAAGGAES